ncbi:MAG TPA: 3-deoxy-manno-octulosonate cytidylyltransferase, partial [Bacteroidota bacterium]
SDRVAAVARSVPGDIFVNIQGDEPLIHPEMIDEAVRTLLDDPDAVVATLAKKIQSDEELSNPAVVKVVLNSRSHALYFSRSPIPHVRSLQDQSQWPSAAIMYKHVGIYVFRRDFLLKYAGMEESPLERAEKLEQLRILEAGEKIAVGITERESVPVDTQVDVDRVLEILKTISPQPMSSKES